MQRAQRKQLREAVKKLQVTPMFAGQRPSLVAPPAKPLVQP